MSQPDGLRVEEGAVGAGDPHHVAEAGEDHAGLPRQGDPVVDPAHRDHADRAAGPVDQLDVVGEQVVDPVLVDRVGVAAADLHQLVVAVRIDASRGSRRPAPGRARRRGTRRRTSCDRRPRVDEQLVVDRDRLHQRDLNRVMVAAPSAHSASSRSASIRKHPHRLSDVAACNAVIVVALAGIPGREAEEMPVVPSLDHARLQLLELGLVVGAHPLEHLAGRARPPPRRPSRSRSRRGSGPSRPAPTPPTSSASSRPMLTLRLTPATSTRASRFDSSTTSRI